jgi:hypothetical protein
MHAPRCTRNTGRGLLSAGDWIGGWSAFFQGNRRTPFYHWYAYREGFSEALVPAVLTPLGPPGRLLDPFAGVGTALFAGSSLGWRTTGIELLPLGVAARGTRRSHPLLDGGSVRPRGPAHLGAGARQGQQQPANGQARSRGAAQGYLCVGEMLTGTRAGKACATHFARKDS